MNITGQHLLRAFYLVDSRPSNGFTTWWMNQAETDTHPVNTARFISDHSSKRSKYLTFVCINTCILCALGFCWWKTLLPEMTALILGSILTVLNVAWARRCMVHARLLASVSAHDLTELLRFYENLLALRRLALPLDEQAQGEVCFLAGVRKAFTQLRDQRRVEVEKELIALGINPEPA